MRLGRMGWVPGYTARYEPRLPRLPLLARATPIFTSRRCSYYTDGVGNSQGDGVDLENPIQPLDFPPPALYDPTHLINLVKSTTKKTIISM